MRTHASDSGRGMRQCWVDLGADAGTDRTGPRRERTSRAEPSRVGLAEEASFFLSCSVAVLWAAPARSILASLDEDWGWISWKGFGNEMNNNAEETSKEGDAAPHLETAIAVQGGAILVLEVI